MVQGRTQKPVVDETKCSICNACLHQCPAEIFVEYRRETDTVRGNVYRDDNSRPSFKKKDHPVPPCQEACPVGQDVRTYVTLIAQQKLREALDVIRETNPLPAICSFVCHHPCEEACARARLDGPVAIRTLKAFPATYASQQGGWISQRRENRGKKVAIVGAGPAGLVAAHDLIRLDYRITLFESLPVAGGMLQVGIPSFRLPREILKAEIDRILALGVDFRAGQTLGRSFTLDDLREEGFEAVFVATGAHRSRRLNIDGWRLGGILGGVEFLRRVNLGKRVTIGHRVAVIGGGNVAIDSARSGLRLGAKEVSIYYRRGRREMPAIAEEIHHARREGIRMHWLTTPKAFIGDNGKVQGILCLRNRLDRKDDSGRRTAVPIQGSEHLVDADTVVIAVGQETGVEDLKTGVRISRHGTIQVDPKTASTSVPGIFAGGDVVTGPGWAIDAIAWGQRAARGIDAYLSGR